MGRTRHSILTGVGFDISMVEWQARENGVSSADLGT